MLTVLGCLVGLLWGCKGYRMEMGDGGMRGGGAGGAGQDGAQGGLSDSDVNLVWAPVRRPRKA